MPTIGRPWRRRLFAGSEGLSRQSTGVPTQIRRFIRQRHDMLARFDNHADLCVINPEALTDHSIESATPVPAPIIGNDEKGALHGRNATYQKIRPVSCNLGPAIAEGQPARQLLRLIELDDNLVLQRLAREPDHRFQCFAIPD